MLLIVNGSWLKINIPSIRKISQRLSEFTTWVMGKRTHGIKKWDNMFFCIASKNQIFETFKLNKAYQLSLLNREA